MTIQVSTGLRNTMLATSPLRTALNLGFLNIYSGPVPATADAAPTGATLLLQITNNSTATGLTFAAAASGGAITKNLSETWANNAVATGTAAFFRFVSSTDTGALSTTDCRIQGSVNTSGADLNMTTTSLVSTTNYSISSFSVTLPTL